MVYFKPGIFQPEPDKSTVEPSSIRQGLGHCSACHAERDPLGGIRATVGGEAAGGGQIMGTNWYAPSLNGRHEAGTTSWPLEEIIQLLTTGVSQRATTSGPMAEVVSQSLQHLDKADARAMAVYLNHSRLPPYLLQHAPSKPKPGYSKAPESTRNIARIAMAPPGGGLGHLSRVGGQPGRDHESAHQRYPQRS